jgi:molybdopterin molybdotransferase
MDSFEVEQIIREQFTASPQCETVPLFEADGRVLFDDVRSDEFVPDFDRSTVDGYAVNAGDVFGCSDAIPALLRLGGEIAAGEETDLVWQKGDCFYVPTGGMMPKGTDAMVMIEYAERFGDGTVAVYNPSAPGQHIIFRGDDIRQGEIAAEKGTLISTRETGALAALGVAHVKVIRKPKVGVISTGDELVSADKKPSIGQIRDVNGPMLASAVREAGGEPVEYGIIGDDTDALSRCIAKASAHCDMLLLSGGTSVGSKDATRLVIEAQGTLLVHGIAIKPGKPTILGSIAGKPVFGLPGHPLAAYFIFKLFARPLLLSFGGRSAQARTVEATLTRAIPSDEGREECVPISLAYTDEVLATPVLGKSGLITTLLGTHGYIRIPRNQEGLSKGSKIGVTLF